MNISKQLILLGVLFEVWCVSTLVPCGDDTFVCDNGECIPMELVCTGAPSCEDESDQTGCDSENPPKCPKSYFRCATSRQCIPIRFNCDGSDNCDDGSDEWNCTVCRANEFECLKNEECVPAKLLCDGRSDCADGSDERSCRNFNGIYYPCWNRNFLCEDGNQCVNRKWLCDGKLDCSDGSDEKQCDGNSSTSTTTQQSCPDNYCKQNGDCVVVGDRYYCNCFPSFTGEKCELRAAAERASLYLGIVIGIAMAVIIL